MGRDPTADEGAKEAEKEYQACPVQTSCCPLLVLLSQCFIQGQSCVQDNRTVQAPKPHLLETFQIMGAFDHTESYSKVQSIQ